jgi:hypothetical protein
MSSYTFQVIVTVSEQDAADSDTVLQEAKWRHIVVNVQIFSQSMKSREAPLRSIEVENSLLSTS